jgi:flagellar protein FliS
MAVSGTSSIDVAGIVSQLMTIELDERLKASLDASAGGELTERLRTLYDFCVMKLLQANLRNDRQALDMVGRPLGEPRDAWSQIRKRQASAAARTAHAAPALRALAVAARGLRRAW